MTFDTFNMADFFKSALGGIIGTGQSREGNNFVGEVVELGNQKLRVKRLVAEGKAFKTFL